MKLKTEKRYPWYIGSAIGILGFLLPAASHGRIIESLAPTAINVGSIAIGFLGSTYSILIAIEGKELIVNLKKAGRYRVILSYLNDAIKAGFAVVLLSAAAMFVDPKGVPLWMKYPIGLWMATMGYAISSAYRVISVVATILHETSDEFRFPGHRPKNGSEN